MPGFTRLSILGLAAALAVGPAVATAAAAPTSSGGATASDNCAGALHAAVNRYINTTNAHNARGFEALMAADYTAVLPGGTTFAGKAAGSAFIDHFFARTDWTQTFQVTRTAVQDCRSALVLFNSTYSDADGPVPLVIGLSWTYDGGRWLVVLDQNTVVDG